VDTNYAPGGKQSDRRYTHFSLLKSLEAAFRLPCLNHACDGSVEVMSDLFAAGRDVIVEGRLTSHNFVTAEQVMTSCPSKYRAKKTG